MDMKKCTRIAAIAALHFFNDNKFGEETEDQVSATTKQRKDRVSSVALGKTTAIED